ncbi:hypothetical protein LUZ60_007086 [Juncus effusus]|nr:hypothetical protein LUZ60_007086 [Juncus effusus]
MSADGIVLPSDSVFGDDLLSPSSSIDPHDQSDNDSINASVESASQFEEYEIEKAPRFEELETENGSIRVSVDSPEFEEPKIGKEFPTDLAAYEFYNMYAFHIGFSVRKENVRKNRRNFNTMRFFSCSKAGVYRNRPKGDKPRKRNELDTRTDCKAHMKINICKKGVYTITSFDPKHKHILATPSKRRFLKSHKVMNDSQKAIADVAESAGLKPKQIYDFMAKQARGRKHLTFLPDDYKNYLRSKRMHAMALGDAGAIMQYLQTRVKEDPSFYYALQVDEDDLITNIFWADGRSLLDYDCFGDVICFDSTYKTNEYGRPFAPFVGVNHHKQTVVFGAGLLYDEKISSFEWLFQTFMHAVGGKAPRVILTDQDAAMSRAIANVWPNTTHRLCVWHMYQNAAKHLSHVFNGSKSFERDFSNCVYDCDDEEEFLEAWNDMIEKYELSQNKWLTELFEIRKKWALVYGRQVFCADMKSTQRSESFNSIIKRYLRPTQRLLDFFNHYERLLEERRDAELLFDFRASQGIPSFQFSDMLKQAGAILTPTVYKVFQAEYMRFVNCEAHYDGQSENMHKYSVISGGSGKKKRCTVWYDSMEDSITCSCLKFEFVGVQCCHVTKVLDTMNIKLLPEKYYLKRWRKDAKSLISKVSMNRILSWISQTVTVVCWEFIPLFF